MPRPLRNRFVHLDLEPDLSDWCKWAVRSGVRPEIIAFLRFKPALLHDADATSDQNAWATPRSWEMASNVLKGLSARGTAPNSAIEAQMIEGTIGPAATAEWLVSCGCSVNSPQSTRSCLPRTPHLSRTNHRHRSRLPPLSGVPCRTTRSQGYEVSRPYAHGDACPRHARCSGARSSHNPHTGVRSLRCGASGGLPMITQKAMLAAVHISIWTATKHDRKVSRDVADRNGARERAGRYNKQLLMGAGESSKSCVRSPDRYASTSTRSRCRGRMKDSGFCLRTSTSTSRRACASLRQALRPASTSF